MYIGLTSSLQLRTTIRYYQSEAIIKGLARTKWVNNLSRCLFWLSGNFTQLVICSWEIMLLRARAGKSNFSAFGGEN